MKRSNKDQEKNPVVQLLDFLSPQLDDIGEFCITGLDIRVRDTRDIQSAAEEIVLRVRNQKTLEKSTFAKPLIHNPDCPQCKAIDEEERESDVC